MPPNYKKKRHHKKRNDRNNNKPERNLPGCSTEEEFTNDTEGASSDDCASLEKPYAIRHSDIMGRYLVASRNLSPGELIIKELPLVVGPCVDSELVCLGCYQPVTLKDNQYRCPGCGWPLCGPKCGGIKNENGHSTWECSILREKRVVNIIDKCDANEIKLMYETIAPLRCLLLKQHNPEKWNVIMKMEAHNDVRKKIPSLWNRNQEVIVNRLQSSWNIRDFTSDEIHTICGVLEVNCFEIGQNGAKARALYPSSFLLSHECAPNTTHADHPITHAMHIRVTKALKKDDPITLSYAYTFQGTLKRREHLQEGKFFWCQCTRCSDPTELGTYSSAMRCPKCRDGLILSTDPLNQKAPWKCKACDYSVTAASMVLLLEKIFKELDTIDPHDVESQEDFLEKYRNVLSKNHYLSISAKYTLCQLYGRIEGYMIQELLIDDLKRKEHYCRDVLAVADVLEPGLSRLRGVIMYELHAPIMIQATRAFENKKISSTELRKRLKEVVNLLRESAEILALEPEGSSEHAMSLAGRDALKRIGNL